MFVVIDTKGANRILINIPSEGAEKSLPAIARMLENNAVFVQQNYYSAEILRPDMFIVLGNQYKMTDNGPEELIIAGDPNVIVEDGFVVARPEVFVSNKTTLAKKDDEINRLRAELMLSRESVKTLTDQLSELNSLIKKSEEAQ